MTGHGSTACGWQDIVRLATLLEDINQIAGDVPLWQLSKDTAQAISHGRRSTAAFVSVLHQAAREQRRAVMADVLAESAADRRREHHIDAQLEACADQEWRPESA